MPIQDRVPRTESETETSAGARMSEVADNLRAAQAYASHYFAAQMDRIRIAVRNLAVISAMAILALVAAAVVVVMSVVLVCQGIAGGLGRLFGGIPWLGDLATGVLILLVLAIGGKVGSSRLTRAARKQMVDSYERRRSQERAQYGADVHGRSEN